MAWPTLQTPQIPRRTNEMRVQYDNPLAPDLILAHTALLLETLQHKRIKQRPGERGLVLLCIGTDRSTGDALGPLVGQHLKEADIPDATILGTLENPVHATNLQDTIAALGQTHPGKPVIAVDACLGQAGNVGTIAVGLGSLQPGAGVNKTLPPVGDIYITATVNIGGMMEYLVLQNTRLSLVMRMAKTIAEGLTRLATIWTSQGRCPASRIVPRETHSSKY